MKFPSKCSFTWGFYNLSTNFVRLAMHEAKMLSPVNDDILTEIEVDNSVNFIT